MIIILLYILGLIILWGILGLVGLLIGNIRQNLFSLRKSDVIEHILYGPIAIYFHLFK
jgi:hypothetical protein